MRTLTSLIIILIGCTSAFAGNLPNEKAFQASLTNALRGQDHEAFYKLVCFDGVDKNWEKGNKQVFEVFFKQAVKTPRFTGSIGAWGGKISQPPPTQCYNLPLVAAYLMNFAPGESINLPLGLKGDQLKVLCVVLKDDAKGQ